MRIRVFSVLVLLAAGWAGVRPVCAVELLKLRHQASLYSDAKETPLRFPQGVACGEGDTFLVADSGNGRVLRAELSGATVLVTATLQAAEVSYPIRVAAAPEGGVFVLDGKTTRLARLRGDGTFAGWIDLPRGEGSSAPVVRSFAPSPGGNLVAVDLAAARVVEIDPAGALRRALPLPAEAGVISDVAVSEQGSIFVLDGTGRRVWISRPGEAAFAPFSESLAEDMDYPSALDVDPSGRVFIADENGGGVVILGPGGSFRGRQSGYGWKEGYLRYPSDLCVNGRGRVVVADRENQRVQVFTVGE